MQVTYRYGENEYQEISGLVTGWWRRWRNLLLPVAGGCVPGTMFLLALRNYVALAVAFPIVAACLLFLMAALLRKVADAGKARPTIKMIVAHDYLEQRVEHAATRWHGSMISRVASHGEYLLIELLGDVLFAVPKRDFANSSEALSFENAVRDAMARHQHGAPSPEDIGDWEPLAEHEDAITVEYINTARHFRHAAAPASDHAGESRQRRSHPISGWLWMFAGTAISATLAATSDSTMGDLLTGLLAFGMMFLWATVYLMHVTQMRRYRMDCRPWKVVVSASGITRSNSQLECHCDWTVAGSIRNKGDVLAIFTESNDLAAAIPKDAFATTQNAQEFYETVLGHWQTARFSASGENTDDSSSPPPQVETGNPYQSPSS
jgi:hypothetical protein